MLSYKNQERLVKQHDDENGLKYVYTGRITRKRVREAVLKISLRSDDARYFFFRDLLESKISDHKDLSPIS